ncbi:MAG: FKBP-type peptidyl-prolyl cis-trans isomerase [Bacteroidetes bacterium]|nr:FKBP-type peptidyl-prolyl cis-trans isomerase [Bacteroidota bacterium]
MNRKLMFLAVAAIAFAGCNSGFKQGKGGMLYDIIVDKSGPKIQPGDFMSVNLTVKTDGDSLLFSTYQQGRPSLTIYQKPEGSGDIMSAFQYLAEGDSAIIKTNIDSVYKKRRPPIKGKYVVYEVKVVKVIQKGKLADSAFNNRITAYLKDQAQEIAKTEPPKIKKYIADNKLNVTTTPSGLNYIITKQGSGEKPVTGDTAVINYTVKFVNNKLLETNIKDVAAKNNKLMPMALYKPIRIPIGARGAIQGMDEGLQLMNKGSEATLIIPSKLAYGEQGTPGPEGVPPYTPLVFEVQLLDVVHPNPNAPKPAPPVINPAPVQPTKPGAK